MKNTNTTKKTNAKNTANTAPTYPQRRALTSAYIHAEKPTYKAVSAKIDELNKALGRTTKAMTKQPTEETLNGPATWNQVQLMLWLYCDAKKLTYAKVSEWIAKLDAKSGYKPTPKAEEPKQEAKAEPKATEKAEQVVQQANAAKTEAKAEVQQALKSNEEVQIELGL